MSDFDDINRGAMFPNDRLKTERSPTLGGHLNVEGTERYMNGWLRARKDHPDGDRAVKRALKFIRDEKLYIATSLGIPKGQVASSSAPPPADPMDDLDDDLPF